MTTRHSPNWRGMFVGIVLCLVVATGAVRVVLTYRVFSQTTDEPAHLAAGMEWLERRTYTFEPLHPPLARIAEALGPYLAGLRLTGQGHLWQEGNEILLAHDQYLHNLSLARLGALPFFLLAAFLVWHWSRKQYGDGSALAATLLFTTSPVVLAHGGLATTDMAATATITAALLALVNLLERATYFRFALLGALVGFAALSKFSALLFLPSSGLALILWRCLLKKDGMRKIIEGSQFRFGRGLALAVLALVLVVWAGYRWSVGSVTDAAARPHPTLDRLFGTAGTLHNWAYSVAESPWVPAPALFQGLAMARQKDINGHKSYLLGQIRQTGWWYFFPVALAVKTPIPFLVLIGLGCFYLGKSAWRERNWVAAAPVVAALALLLVCMPVRINIGVRHILPIYPLFAIIGGVATCHLWSSGRPKYLGAAVVLGLLAWQLTSSFRARPDYLAYFNELAGQNPEKILIDSDLDWGQDLLRLSTFLQQRHVKEISIAYAGSPELDLNRFGLPPFQILAPKQPTAGWIAISLLKLKTGGFGSPSDSFSWLDAYKPVCLVGRSIRLYYVPEAGYQEPGQAMPKSHSSNDQ
jgi:hypothetical protein